MEEEDDNALGGKEMNKKTELNVGEEFGVEPFSDIRGVVYVAQSNNAVPTLSRPLS